MENCCQAIHAGPGDSINTRRFDYQNHLLHPRPLAENTAHHHHKMKAIDVHDTARLANTLVQ